MIVLNNVIRDFRSGRNTIRALDNISFRIPSGQSVALLGVNGAGKTTLSKILATWIYPSAGTVNICGFDVVKQSAAAARCVVPVFGGDLGLYPMLTGRENLRYFSSIRGQRDCITASDIDRSLEEVGLGKAKNRRVEEYSRGMKQRLHLAVGLASNAPIIILDEPTAGLDPIEAIRFRGTICELAKQGRTILLTSHNLADVEETTERVLFLSSGHLRHDLPLTEFKKLAGYRYRLKATTRCPITLDDYSCEKNPDGTYSVQRLLGANDLTTITRMLAEIGDGEVIDFSLSEPTLDEAFSAAAQGNGNNRA